MKRKIPQATLFGENLSKDILDLYNEGMQHKRLKNYHEAIDCFKKTISLEPDFMFPYFLLGQCYVDIKNWKDVIPCFTKVCEMVDDEGDAYFFIGVSHFNLGDYPLAIQNIEKSIKVGLKDNKPDLAYYYWAMSEKMRVLQDDSLPFLQKWDKPLELIDKALNINPNAKYFIEKANILVGLNALDAALEIYKSIFDQVEFSHEMGIHAALGMATCYSMLHEYEKCLKLLPKILKVVPEIKSQMALDSGFDNIRNSTYKSKFEKLLI